MILDSKGKKLQKTKTAKAVFFMSEDCETWSAIKPEDVPESLKDKDAMGYLMSGEVLESPDNLFYRVGQL